MKKYFTIIALFICSNSFAQVTNGLISHYKFSGNANDELNANNGLVYGATLTTDRFGSSNSAYSFDGFSGDYISLGTNNSLKPSNVTISLWAYIDSLEHYHTALNYQPFIIASNLNNPNPYYEAYAMGYWTPTPRLLAMSYEAGMNGGQACFSVDSISTKRWYHHVLKFNNDSVWMYINNQLTNVLPKGFVTTYNSDAVLLGKTNTASKEGYLNGKLDDIRIYNRVLSNIEIDSLFNEHQTFPEAIYTQNQAVNNIILYPNPVNEKLFIDSDKIFESFKITDVLGNIVCQNKIENSQAFIDLQQIAKGQYIITLIDKNKFTYSRIFVKK